MEGSIFRILSMFCFIGALGAVIITILGVVWICKRVLRKIEK